MSRPEERISDMVSSGKVSPEEGAKLLAAMDAESGDEPALLLWLAPFSKLAPRVAAGVIGLGLVAQLAATRTGLVFDSMLNVSRRPPPGLHWCALHLLIDLALPCLLFALMIRAAGKSARLQDVAIVVGLARLPLLFALLVSPWLDATRAGASPERLAFATVGALVGVGWVLLLLFRGIRWAGDLRGWKLWAVFLGGLVAAELATRAVIGSLVPGGVG